MSRPTRFIASISAVVALGLCAGAPADAATVSCPQATQPVVGCNVGVAEGSTLDFQVNIITLTATFLLDVPTLDNP